MNVLTVGTRGGGKVVWLSVSSGAVNNVATTKIEMFGVFGTYFKSHPPPPTAAILFGEGC